MVYNYILPLLFCRELANPTCTCTYMYMYIIVYYRFLTLQGFTLHMFTIVVHLVPEFSFSNSQANFILVTDQCKCFGLMLSIPLHFSQLEQSSAPY